MATAEMEPEVVAEAPPEDKPAATPESENERILREIAAQEEVVAGRERIVDDFKSKLKEAKDDYEDAVLCLRHLCRSKANDDNRPLLKPGATDALSGEPVVAADAATEPSDDAGDTAQQAADAEFTEEITDEFRDAGILADGKKKKRKK